VHKFKNTDIVRPTSNILPIRIKTVVSFRKVKRYCNLREMHYKPKINVMRWREIGTSYNKRQFYSRSFVLVCPISSYRRRYGRSRKVRENRRDYPAINTMSRIGSSVWSGNGSCVDLSLLRMRRSSNDDRHAHART